MTKADHQLAQRGPASRAPEPCQRAAGAVVAAGQTKTQPGGVRPTKRPSGHCVTSCVHTMGERSLAGGVGVAVEQAASHRTRVAAQRVDLFIPRIVVANGAVQRAASPVSVGVVVEASDAAAARARTRVAVWMPQTATNIAAITGPITKPLMPITAMPPTVLISTR